MCRAASEAQLCGELYNNKIQFLFLGGSYSQKPVPQGKRGVLGIGWAVSSTAVISQFVVSRRRAWAGLHIPIAGGEQ